MTGLAHRYRVTGTLIPICADHVESDAVLVAGAPIGVDLVVRSTDPRFAAHAAGWHITLGYAAWRWETPPDVIRLED